jgi:hypothetical protein
MSNITVVASRVSSEIDIDCSPLVGARNGLLMWKSRRAQQHPVFEKLDSRGGFTGLLASFGGCRLERGAASAEAKKPPEQSSEHRDFLGVRMTARPSFRSEREQPGPRASTLVTSAVPPVFLRLESA